MGGDPSDDFYALLGIDADANGAQVRRVWRKLALRWHPDRAGPGATATFQKLSAAYAVLSDPVARAAYDRRRVPPAKSAPPATPRRRAPGVMLQRLSGSLQALVACGVARRVGSDVIELSINAEEAAQGGMVTISMPVPVRRPEGIIDELFSAWLALPPEVSDGAILHPSVPLRGMVQPVRFRIRVRKR
jgi:curved DNA-binding protein CbpA